MNIRRFLADKFQLYWLALNYWLDGDDWCLRDILEDDPQIEIPDYVASRLNGAYRDRPIISDPERDELAPTCVAHYAKDLSTRLVRDGRFPHGVRPYTVREYGRLQGVPDTLIFFTEIFKISLA